MAIIIGRRSKIAVSINDVTYNDIGKVMSGSLGSSIDIADATTNDSGGFKEGEYADQQATVDVTAKYDSANLGQAAILTEVYTNRAKVWIRIRPEVSVGQKEWKFLATIDDATIDASTGEVEEFSFTGSSSGTITIGTQT